MSVSVEISATDRIVRPPLEGASNAFAAFTRGYSTINFT
jgi:hypothetical protein